MRIRALIYCGLTIALFLAALTGVSAQDSKKDQIVVAMKDGYFVSFSITPEANPANANGWTIGFVQ